MRLVDSTFYVQNVLQIFRSFFFWMLCVEIRISFVCDSEIIVSFCVSQPYLFGWAVMSTVNNLQDL